MIAERPDSSYKHPPKKTTKSFAKALDTYVMGTTLTQKVDYALIKGRFFHLSNNIIIFSHQLLQTANVLLVFLILHKNGTLLPWAYLC